MYIFSISLVILYENRRALSMAKRLASLKDDDSVSAEGSIDAVYILPDVDEITNKEDIANYRLNYT